LKHGKHFCGIDLSETYLDLARKRIAHFKKVGHDENWSKSTVPTLGDF